MRWVCVLVAVFLCILPAFTIASCTSPDINITNFQVIPSDITAGQSAVLKWDVTGANSITIDNSPGVQPASGSVEIKPMQTTSYKLTAKNSSKSAESSVILTVNDPPFSATTTPEAVPVLSALDTQGLIRHIGKQVRVEGDVTYISSWIPTRLRGFGTSSPYIFMFFMKDVQEGAADNAGDGEYCPECWRDYTSQFRVIITPENLPALFPMLNSNFGFVFQEQWPTIGATTGRLVFMPNQMWSHGYIAQSTVHVTVVGQLTNYLSAPAIYLTNPGQLTLSKQ
ncbi:MAG: hypothetical protein EHM12_01460 [Dehalococcoidia bacterium]|nr:MAG: hypothetical protein EHM12_01460 [Dehalococcoidia bacterium]